MKLSCVIVCVNYSDFLAHTLPTNKAMFDELIVVTSPADISTKKLCEFWHVKCIVSNECWADKSEFNKGKMINVGLSHLDHPDWTVHMDADIFLPPQFRILLNSLPLDKEFLYGVDRLMCYGYENWVRFWLSPTISNENDIFVHPRPFEPGVRVSKIEKGYDGYIPIGFFQLWNQNFKNLNYPTQHTTAGRSDLLFALNFPRNKRALIPEFFVIHLESPLNSKFEMGGNWFGRKTEKFAPIEISEDSII